MTGYIAPSGKKTLLIYSPLQPADAHHPIIAASMHDTQSGPLLQPAHNRMLQLIWANGVCAGAVFPISPHRAAPAQAPENIPETPRVAYLWYVGVLPAIPADCVARALSCAELP